MVAIFVIILSKSPPQTEEFGCQNVDIYQDKNYLVPYSFFLLEYIGLGSDSSSEVLKAITFQVNKGAKLSDANSLGFDTSVVDALYSGQETNKINKLCVYDVSLISTKDLPGPKPIVANEKLVNMYWLISVDGNTSKVLNSLILESFG